MLEFLGMEREAATLITCLIVLGLSVGAIGGYTIGAKEHGKGVFGIILLVICCISGCASILIGLFPGIALFFTFQWGIWIKGIFFGCIAGFLLGYIIYSITLSARIRKYARNPITKEAVQFIKENPIDGILCYKDSLYFFQKLTSTAFCKAQNYQTNEYFASNESGIRLTHRTSTGLDTQLSSGKCIGKIIFSEKGYPELPDLAVFSKALAKQLPAFARVHHHAKTDCYNTLKSTHYITHFYDAYFLYNRKAYHELQKQEFAQPKETKKENTNTWE